MGDTLVERLADKSMSTAELKESVLRNPALLSEVLVGVNASKAAVRYGCSKVLLELSEDSPDLLYPHMDFFVHLLDSKYRILTWNALTIIARLTGVDTKKKFDEIVEKYFGFFHDDYMVTVATVVENAGTIARAKPYLIPKITKELLKVGELKTGKHLTAECRLVIAEKAIDSLTMFFDQVTNKQDVLSFVEQWTTSRRRPLREKARRFMNQWETSTT